MYNGHGSWVMGHERWPISISGLHTLCARSNSLRMSGNSLVVESVQCTACSNCLLAVWWLLNSLVVVDRHVENVYTYSNGTYSAKYLMSRTDVNWVPLFTVRRSALHGLCDSNSVRPSVRPSLCLSHSWTVSTWFDLRSWFLHHRVAPSF